jgi:hypothetical protein
LEAVRRSVVSAGECADAPAWASSGDSLMQCLDGIETAERFLATAKLHVVREIDVRGLPAAQGTRNTGMWLRDRLHMTSVAGRRLVRLAKAADASPVLDQALRRGAVNTEQASAIVKSMDALPADVGAEVTAKAEATLVEWAGRVDPQALAIMGARVLEHVAPEVAEAAERKRVERDNASAFEARTLSLCPQGDGRVRVAGWLDSEMAAVVNAALEPLCSPRHRGSRRRGPGNDAAEIMSLAAGATGLNAAATAGDAAAAATTGDAACAAADRPGRVDPVVADSRTYGQRRADALIDVCRLVLNTGELPDNGGERPQINVTVRFEDLRDQVGVATLDTGQRLTAAQARRLACDAHLLPAVLGTQGQVLDVGQSRRLITGALRRALVLRDGGCAFPDCDRPPRWAEGHHIRSWANGGPTSLDKPRFH